LIGKVVAAGCIRDCACKSSHEPDMVRRASPRAMHLSHN
jgi:hypothetical protein